MSTWESPYKIVKASEGNGYHLQDTTLKPINGGPAIVAIMGSVNGAAICASIIMKAYGSVDAPNEVMDIVYKEGLK